MKNNWKERFEQKLKNLNFELKDYVSLLRVKENSPIESNEQALTSKQSIETDAFQESNESKDMNSISINDENSPSNNSYSMASEQLMKSILLIDSCLVELEMSSWQKEIIHDEAKRLSKQFSTTNQAISTLNSLITLLTIPEPICFLLSSPIKPNTIDNYISSVEVLQSQYNELLQIKYEINPILLEESTKKFESLFTKIGINIREYFVKIINKENNTINLQNELLENHHLYFQLIKLKQNEIMLEIMHSYSQFIIKITKSNVTNFISQLKKSLNSFVIPNFSSIQVEKRTSKQDLENPFLLENKFCQFIRVIDNLLEEEFNFVQLFFKFENIKEVYYKFLLNIEWLKVNLHLILLLLVCY